MQRLFRGGAIKATHVQVPMAPGHSAIRNAAAIRRPNRRLVPALTQGESRVHTSGKFCDPHAVVWHTFRRTTRDGDMCSVWRKFDIILSQRRTDDALTTPDSIHPRQLCEGPSSVS